MPLNGSNLQKNYLGDIGKILGINQVLQLNQGNS